MLVLRLQSLAGGRNPAGAIGRTEAPAPYSMTELWRLDASAVAQGIRGREFSAREVMMACLERLEAVNPVINAITEYRPEQALAAADAADRVVQRGERLGPLHGVPVTIKGNVDVAGWATVNGCAALTGNIAPDNSACVQNWLDAGAIVLGRTNTPEFCCRWDTSNEVYGVTHNPWDRSRTPGGSSGGAAASLAVGIAPLAHGNDLGGSLRHPAQACGIASIRPSFGRVPNWNPTDPVEHGPGLQLMHVEGPMARCVRDVQLGLQAMAARSWRDPWWVPAPLEEGESAPRTIALVVNPAGGGVHRQVAAGVTRAGRLLEAAGFNVTETEPPGISDAAQLWRTICLGELLTQLEPAVRDVCGDRLRRTLGYYHAALPAFGYEDYRDAFAQRRRILRDWQGFFERFDLIVAPVGTEPPLPSDADVATAEQALASIESFRMTVAVNALGLPAAVVPVGVADGLPQVVQVIGPRFAELRCLAAAAAIEEQAGPLTPIDPR